MRKEKAIGYDIINVLSANIDGFKELWDKSEFDSKEAATNGVGDLAYKLLKTSEICDDDCKLNHCDEVSHRKEESEENTVHNMASCMLSILDSVKLHDKGSLDLRDETLSEVMFRKMKGYDIDLNKELGFTHLCPVKKEDIKSNLNSEKESLILKVINNGKKGLEKTQKSHEEMIEDYQNNGFGDMHPGNIESHKTGLSYTLGYTFGHLELLKSVNNLMNMSPEEIRDLILENKRIEKENKKHMDDILKEIKLKNKKL